MLQDASASNHSTLNLQLQNTEWTQKHSLISSSYKIKTYWNIFINIGLQIHWLKKFLIFPPAARGQWNARWRSLHSNAAGACWNFIKQTVLWLCSVLSNANLMWIRLLTSPFLSGTGISLKEDASVIRERDIQADCRSRSELLIASENPFCAAPDITGPDRLWLFTLGVREGQSLCTSTTRNSGWAAGTHHCSCQLSHAGYAAESLVRARLSHRCLPSNKMGAHWVCVIPHETVWVYATVATKFVRIFQ